MYHQTLIACRAIQLRLFKVEPLLNNAFKIILYLISQSNSEYMVQIIKYLVTKKK